MAEGVQDTTEDVKRPDRRCQNPTDSPVSTSRIMQNLTQRCFRVLGARTVCGYSSLCGEPQAFLSNKPAVGRPRHALDFGSYLD